MQPQRVHGLDSGFYHHDRAQHRLVRMSPERFDPAAFGPAERPLWTEAAFGLFLLVDLRAVVPMYREAGLRFADIEAGLM